MWERLLSNFWIRLFLVAILLYLVLALPSHAAPLEQSVYLPIVVREAVDWEFTAAALLPRAVGPGA
jgi:hypothetical protein